MIGKEIAGDWELQLPDTEPVRRAFQLGQISDLLLIVSVAAKHPRGQCERMCLPAPRPTTIGWHGDWARLCHAAETLRLRLCANTPAA